MADFIQTQMSDILMLCSEAIVSAQYVMHTVTGPVLHVNSHSLDAQAFPLVEVAVVFARKGILTKYNLKSDTDWIQNKTAITICCT